MRLTEKTFKNGMYSLGLIFDRDVTDPQLNSLYWLALSEYPDEAVKNAFTQVISTCKWFPRPADLVEAIAGARKGRNELAWAEVTGKLDTWGGMWNHEWQTDGATADAVKALGGWSYLSGLRLYDLGKLKDAFISAYERAVSVGRQYTIAKVIGCRDRDFRTGELVPLTIIRDENRQVITIPAGSSAVLIDGKWIDSEEFIAVIPGETEKRMADLMIAKRMQ